MSAAEHEVRRRLASATAWAKAGERAARLALARDLEEEVLPALGEPAGRQVASGGIEKSPFIVRRLP